MSQEGERSEGRAGIGGRLREAREAKGISAEAAAEATSVPLRYVRMFEEGRYPAVADPAYLTGFLRRYAAYLDLDAWKIARDFIAETEPDTALRRTGKLAPEPRAEPPPPTVKRKGVTMKDDDKRIGKVESGAPGAPPPRPTDGARWFDAGPLSLIGLAVTTLAAVGLYWARHSPESLHEVTTQVESSAPAAAPAKEPERASAEPAESAAASAPAVGEQAPAVEHAPAPAEPAPQVAAAQPASPPAAPPPPAEPPAAPVAKAEPPPPPVAKPVAPAPAAPMAKPAAPAPPAVAARPASASGGPYELKLTGTAREVWIWISVDGGPRQEKKITAGESASWKAERNFVLTLDDAGGVRAQLNGEELPRLGPSQQARKNVTIPET